MGYWPYLYLFRRYKSDCTLFFETGTYMGDSVQDALDVGFERVISIEVEERFYDHCVQRFKPLHYWNKINLFLGSTEDNIEKLIQEHVDERTMFWLDAHDTGSPYKTEIEAILKHKRNDHVIIIDDIEKYKIDTNWIKNTLATHNPLYTFTLTNIHPDTGGQFIAYIP